MRELAAAGLRVGRQLWMAASWRTANAGFTGRRLFLCLWPEGGQSLIDQSRVFPYGNHDGGSGPDPLPLCTAISTAFVDKERLTGALLLAPHGVDQPPLSH